MPKVRIVTDSTSDLPASLREQYGITMVPLDVRFGQEVFKDQVDMSSEEFYARLRNNDVLPRTSQPAPGDFLRVYGQLADEYDCDAIVSIHLSSKLSGTFQAAQVASEMASVPVAAIDSLGASAGLGWTVLAAAIASRRGEDLEAVKARALQVAGRMHMYFSVDTLKFLEQNGRIGKAQSLLGSLLRLKPVVRLNEGEVEPYDKVRGREALIERMTEIARERAQGDRLIMGIVHGDARERAEKYRESLERAGIVHQVRIFPAGPVIGSHCGPGLLGACFFSSGAPLL